MKILTIGIPTYKRTLQLMEQLWRLESQVNESVAVLVLDNDSSSITFPGWVRYLKNPVNVGGDLNFARIVETCETPWLWILGDDDPVRPDAVETILEEIRRFPYASAICFDSGKDEMTGGLYDLIRVCNWGHLAWLSTNVYNVGRLYQVKELAYGLSHVKCAMPLILSWHLERNGYETVRFSKSKIIESQTPPRFDLEGYARRMMLESRLIPEDVRPLVFAEVMFLLKRARLLKSISFGRHLSDTFAVLLFMGCGGILSPRGLKHFTLNLLALTLAPIYRKVYG